MVMKLLNRAKLDGMISAGRFVTILRIRDNGAPLIVLKSCDFKDNEFGYSNRLIEQVLQVGKYGK